MASAFGHAAASLALSQAGILRKSSWKLLLAGVVLSILPDADSIGYALGIAYNSFWGHRGFSHSIVFAAIVSFLVMLWLGKGGTGNEKPRIFLFLLFSCVSHSLLDAMTTGGLGVAFFAPFDNSRYFFPFRPIKVSPLSVKAFFEGRGWIVIRSEAVWIGIPCLVIFAWSFLIRLLNKNNDEQTGR